jgi:DNA polymerase-4
MIPRYATSPSSWGAVGAALSQRRATSARIRGVRSAMPMFKALELCPAATVISPNMTKYAAVAREVRALMLDLTPLVEPLSVDEAFLDLSGTERLHGRSPALSLAKLARDIDAKIGITVSIGLSHNKFLAKVASDLEKPRGFSVIGEVDTQTFLASKPVSVIWGVGKVLQAKLASDGITLIGQIQAREKADLIRRYGSYGYITLRAARMCATSRSRMKRRASARRQPSTKISRTSKSSKASFGRCASECRTAPRLSILPAGR